MNAAEINIDCLRAAERLLRDHDAKITAAADELKLLKRDWVALSERVQACIDVLCGRGTPDLFAHPPAAQVPAPAADVPTTPAKVRKIAQRDASESDEPPPPFDDNTPAAAPKGERIDSLGVALDDLESATSLAGADYGSEVAVKNTVTVNARRYVVASASYFGQNERTYDVLPLYTLAEFAQLHPDTATYSTLTPPDPKGRGGRAPGEYGGLMVTVGRGKSKEVLVVGLKNEQRRLLWVKTVNPYDVPPPKKAKAPRKPAAAKPKARSKAAGAGG